MMGPGNGGRPSRMVLVRFRVRGFRCIQDAELVLEPGVTVLIGRNDVGKTALLDALHQYGQVGRLGLRHVSRNPELTGGETPTTFEAKWRDTVSGEELRHKLCCDPESPYEVLDAPSGHYDWDPRKRWLVANGVAFEPRGVKRSSFLGAIPLEEWRTETDVPDDVAQVLARTGEFLTPTPYLFQPDALAAPTPLGDARVDSSGFGCSLLLQELITRRDGAIDSLEAYMKRLFPFFRRARAIEERWEVQRHVSGSRDETEGEADGQADASGPAPELIRQVAETSSRRRAEFEVDAAVPGGLGLRPEPRWVHAHAESSGVLLALAYFTVAAHAEPGALLALEEPENGLNAAIVLEMMRLFLELIHVQGHQLIMTTHNPYWLDLVGPRGVRVVTRDDDGTHIHQDPENLQRIRDEGVYFSEAVWLGGPEELLRKRGGDE